MSSTSADSPMWWSGKPSIPLEKKLAPALFVNDFCSPKETTPESSEPQRLLIPKVMRVATIGTLRYGWLMTRREAAQQNCYTTGTSFFVKKERNVAT